MSVDEAIGGAQPDDRTPEDAPDEPRDDQVTGTRSDTATAVGSPDADPPEMAPVLDDLAAAAEMDAEPAKRRDLTTVRRIAIAAWLVVVGVEFYLWGLALDRTSLLVIMCLGLLANCIGRRKMITVIIDWLPFALILVLYDLVRQFAEVIDMPVQWHLAVDADHAMFGVNPTAWLQTHLKQATAPWWEVLVSVVYMSYFIVPYAVAGVLWLRDRAAWRRYAACFIATSFLALVGYTLVPAAPPWAAARCTPVEVADHPHDPICMYEDGPTAGNLLGDVEPTHEGALPYVERISARGWEYLGIGVAHIVETGQGKSNLVAAIPSLHAGLTMLVALFMWPRVKALGRILFMGYAWAMAFALVYTAEHYVFDILLGWALAAAVIVAYRLIDRRWLIPRARRRAAESDPDAGFEDRVSAAG